MWVEGWGNLPGQLVVVSGPSGSGKSSILRAALARPDLNVVFSVSATTRQKRPGEVDGVNYYFKDFETFRSEIERDEFLEHAEYNNHLYGTPARPVFESLKTGKSVLLEIEVQGAKQIRLKAPSSLFVFIRTRNFRVLEERLRGRGTDTEEAIFWRLRKGREELAEAHWYDVQLVNDDFDACVEEFVKVLKENGCGGGTPDA
jgi:guanylate kinase